MTPKEFDKAEQRAKANGLLMETELVISGIIKDGQLGQIIANHLKIDYVDILSESIPRNIISLIPQSVAKKQQAIPFREDEQTLHIATCHPDNYEFFELLKKKTGKKIKLYYATPFSIKNAFKVYKNNLEDRIKGILDNLQQNPNNEDSIVDLVNMILEYSHDSRASDIHIEPLEESVSIRLRIDGVLHEVASYPKTLHDKIVFRIKILSNMKTDEHAAAQDGRMTYAPTSSVHDNVDIRVSILPITEGENIVMRLLASTSQRFFLEDIGLLPRDFEIIKNASEKTYGMILTVGPTGSGKTTTLYAILELLNKPEVNIMTIEDPVEYNVSHVQQTQVNAKKNLTFSTGLRTIVRQDPDIVMVGEIRDHETADIAVNAAMTGHLVLSTLHANNAPTTFPRLLDMGIEPFLVASSVNVVIAQRLVRTICSRCRTSYVMGDSLETFKHEPELMKALTEISGREDLKNLRLYKGMGCDACEHTGYSGRKAIFEILEMNEQIQSLITGKVSSEVIEREVRKLGMKTMVEDGVTKALQAITTLEEVLRVVKS